MTIPPSSHPELLVEFVVFILPPSGLLKILLGLLLDLGQLLSEPRQLGSLLSGEIVTSCSKVHSSEVPLQTERKTTVEPL